MSTFRSSNNSSCCLSTIGTSVAEIRFTCREFVSAHGLLNCGCPRVVRLPIVQYLAHRTEEDYKTLTEMPLKIWTKSWVTPSPLKSTFSNVFDEVLHHALTVVLLGLGSLVSFLDAQQFGQNP
jgi:hypothetical protein